MREEIHRPVLVKEVIAHLIVKRDGFYIDGTLGAGGHAEAILDFLGERGRGEGGRLMGVDRDAEIITIAQKKLEKFGKHFVACHGSYEDLGNTMGASRADGILLDLGLSSFQLDQAERGFSFHREGPLDMRMDRSFQKYRTTASEILSRSSEKTLERILKNSGERFASRIAKAIVDHRKKTPLETTTQLADLILKVVPNPRRASFRHWIHPATKTFQALRIEVNRELERLGNFLQQSPVFLNPGGRLVILSYHSLEDRLVKDFFRQKEKEGIFKRITRKPTGPSEEEIRDNPRSRSAKLRAGERSESC